MRSFGFLKTFISPFKPLKIKLYLGKIRYGTPYFLPRIFVKDPNNPGYLKPIPKKVGFDFVGLGYKTKWNKTDYRFEWEPIWSFVFFGFQIALIFRASYPEHYWVCWLTYINDTDRSLSSGERIKQAQKVNPEVWAIYTAQGDIYTDYWNKVLK
jgi:hypothetical protein